MTARSSGSRSRDLPTDEALLQRFRADPDSADARRAAGDLLMRHKDRLYAWCWRLVRDHERALDMSQEVMLLAYRALPSFEGRSQFSSWLFMIARRRCLREIRRPRLLMDETVDPDAQADAEREPAAEFEQRETEEEMFRLMSTDLEPLEQRAIWLRCFEGLPVDSVTDLLGIAKRSGARGVLQSARRKLREAIERSGRMEDHS